MVGHTFLLTNIIATLSISPNSVEGLGESSAISPIQSLILPEESSFEGMSADSFFRTVAGN